MGIRITGLPAAQFCERPGKYTVSFLSYCECCQALASGFLIPPRYTDACMEVGGTRSSREMLRLSPC